MIHRGLEPPWEGSGRYGRWNRGPGLWDGTGFIWTWELPEYEQTFFYSSSLVSVLGAVLKRHYTPFLDLLEAE